MTRKVLFCSTSTRLSTGYARIAWQILNFLKDKCDLYHLAFQYNNLDKIPGRDVEGVTVLPDDMFGYDSILGHIENVKPEVVILYNDVIVGMNFCDRIKTIEKNFKFYVYIDLTYEHQRYIRQISHVADKVIAFNSWWRDHLVNDMGINATYIDHPPIKVSKNFKKNVLNFKDGDFIVLNLNRNSYRKCLDISIEGFVKFFKHNNCSEKIKLFLGCKFGFDGCYDIVDLVLTFARIHKLSDEERDILMNKCIMRFPYDSVPDSTIHSLYDSCHVGLNTTCGEGWGLCNIEHQMFGKPQVVTKIKNFQKFFKKDFTYFLDPVVKVYNPKSNDVVGGFMEIPHSDDVAKGLQYLYDNPRVREEWGKAGKEHIESMTNNFNEWASLVTG